MLTLNKSIHGSIAYDFTPEYQHSDLLFFDIETTGFAADTTILYLIGCIYYKDEKWNLTQWFADNRTSEKEMLIEFFTFMKNYKALVHYNGNGFDIPYLLRKCKKYNLEYNFEQIESIDIYKRILPYKKILKTENLKQKSIERFLELNREDTYSGGQLIQVYAEYLKNKYEVKQAQNQSQISTMLETAENQFNLLILHNEEDLVGMLKVAEIINYADLFEKVFSIVEYNLTSDEISFSLKLQCFLPKRVSYGNELIYFTAYQNTGMFKIKLYRHELKYFYSNFKDYYYLPEEDTAIHKSVAFYVDKDFRTKARAANCYSKKTGCFLPQFGEGISPYFKIDYFDKITYIEATDEFLENRELTEQYIGHLLNKLTAL